MATEVADMQAVMNGRAYLENGAKFDIEPRLSQSQSSMNGYAGSDTESESAKETIVNPELSLTSNPPKQWEVDVCPLINTKKWLQIYGLKKNRLDMHHLLPRIGFKHSDKFDKTLKKPICSRYGLNLFQKYFRSDGKTFNIACNKDQLRDIETRLSQAVCLYKRRMEWLNSESRRIIGVIEEKCVVFVLDIKSMSPQQWNQYKVAFERVLREQGCYLAKFNIIRASEDLSAYNTSSLALTKDSLSGAVEWLWGLDRCAPTSRTSTCEALMKALSDNNAEAVYLFTEGSASDGSRELLREKLTGIRVPLHIASYNCSNGDTIDFLKDLCKLSGGRFHAYAVTMEMDSYEGAPVDPATNHANILLRKKTYGGVPPGAGMREDVILLFEELEEARNNLAQVQGLLEDFPKLVQPNSSYKNPYIKEESKEDSNSETYMSSREWLKKYGLKTKKLGFYDILSGVAFKHQDGVVGVMSAPWDEYQTDAVVRSKLVNARYCDRFPHVLWKNGDLMHVQVTPDIHRSFEQRMTLALEGMQRRIDWLQQGSRELFGTVIEDQIYFLIDTSASMSPHIQFVKDRLFVLMQEQLRHKQKFNFIAFDSKAFCWKDRVVEVNEKNLQHAWQWIKSLECRGSTNTMGALRHALSDHNTQAIYLLSDGRPDQPPRSILAQVQLHPRVPIHTISFNCADREANEFLCKLAKDTGGRFHYYSENGEDFDGPEPWESEDIRMLRQEMETGLCDLQKVATLRDECAALGFKKEEASLKCSRGHSTPQRASVSALPPMSPRNLYRTDQAAVLERPQSAPGFRSNSSPVRSSNRGRPSTAHGTRSSGTMVLSLERPSSAASSRISTGNPMRPLTANSQELMMNLTRKHKRVAAHTKTSVLRTLQSYDYQYGYSQAETKAYDRQWKRHQRPAGSGGKKKKGKKTISKKSADSKDETDKKVSKKGKSKSLLERLTEDSDEQDEVGTGSEKSFSKQDKSDNENNGEEKQNEDNMSADGSLKEEGEEEEQEEEQEE